MRERTQLRTSPRGLDQFRTDVEGFVALEIVEGCVGDYREQLPARGTRYGAFVDPAGGSGPDAMTLAIAHKARRDDRIIIDAVREMRPPFNPTVVVDEFAELLKSYEVTEVVGALVLLQTEFLSSLYGQRAMQPWRHGTLRFHGC